MSNRTKIITTVYDDDTIFPFFWKHYGAIATKLFVLLHNHKTNPLYQRLNKWNGNRKRGLIVRLLPGTHGTFTGRRDADARNRLMKKMRGEGFCGWWIVADLDEFHQLPMDMERFVSFLDGCGYDYVRSMIVDCIAEDGALAAIDENMPLCEQYPAKRRVTRDILGACTAKVCMVKSGVVIADGHHGCDGKRPWPQTFVTLHYKWTNRLIERTNRRIAANDWPEEARRLLAHLGANGGKINCSC